MAPSSLRTGFGYTADEVKSGLFRFPDYVHPDDRVGVVAAWQRVIHNNADLFERDYRITTRDGSIRWIHDRTVAIRDETGTIRAYRGTLIDITERYQTEERLRRANRALRTLSDANGVLVRAQCEADLLRETCRVLVQVGGYRLAWIAYAERDAGKSVRTAATFGNDPEILDKLAITWDDSERGRGTIGRAIRTGQSQITGISPLTATWRPGVSCP